MNSTCSEQKEDLALWSTLWPTTYSTARYTNTVVQHDMKYYFNGIKIRVK